MADPVKLMMDPEVLQPFMQPYVRLAQRNVQLLTQFSASPEMISLWMVNAQKMFEQATRSAASGQTEGDSQKIVQQVQSNLSQVGQSKAFSELVQGLMQSHTQFLFDLAQTGMTAFGQEQGKLIEQMQQAASNVVSIPAQEEKRPRRRREDS